VAGELKETGQQTAHYTHEYISAYCQHAHNSRITGAPSLISYAAGPLRFWENETEGGLVWTRFLSFFIPSAMEH